MSVLTAGVVAVSLAAVLSTASSLVGSTPLYIFRMEQQSKDMNFLPTAANGFSYTTEKGFALNCNVGCCGAMNMIRYTSRKTVCIETCFSTLPCGAATCSTCPLTCESTCPETCDDPTCPSTCPATCPDTCYETCDDPTCLETCEQTCMYTCTKPCQP